MTPAAMCFAGVAAWLPGWGAAQGMAGLARVRDGRRAWALPGDDTFNHQAEETP